MNQFLKPEILTSQNKRFCSPCNLLCESTRETCIMNSAPILIIQLCRLSNQVGQLVKNENLFSCTWSESNKDLAVSITKEDEVPFTNKYSLVAAINHLGTLNKCHYWAFIKLQTTLKTEAIIKVDKIVRLYYNFCLTTKGRTNQLQKHWNKIWIFQ